MIKINHKITIPQDQKEENPQLVDFTLQREIAIVKYIEGMISQEVYLKELSDTDNFFSLREVADIMTT
jgi:hypothetical protein